MLPGIVHTTNEFQQIESNKNALVVEKYNLLMRSIKANHQILSDCNVCACCSQDLTYLVYTKQIECFRSTQNAAT